MIDPPRLLSDPDAPPRVRAVLAVARRTPAMPAAVGARTRPDVRRARSLVPAAAAGLAAWVGWKSLAVAAGIGIAGAAYVALRATSPTHAPIAPSAPPSTSAAPRPRPRSFAPVASSSAPAVAPRASLEEEVQLVGAAQSALSAEPAKALDIANTHAARYPNGQLRLEREVLAIDALERLGRVDAARARARAALKTARGSIYEARLRALAGADE